jgi:phosphohistidine swiveling domain-containing protein
MVDGKFLSSVRRLPCIATPLIENPSLSSASAYRHWHFPREWLYYISPVHPAQPSPPRVPEFLIVEYPAMGFLVSLREGRVGNTIGNKAAQLAFLQKKAFTIPETFCIRWQAYEAAQANSQKVLALLREEFSACIDPSRPYAVRSSANVEDTIDHSFAGQFVSVLDVQGVDAIIQAIEHVWASACAPGVLAYVQKHGCPGGRVRMGVILQPMVPAHFSGVAFSINPLTGANEVVVESVAGRGDRLVQHGVTPERWIGKWGGWRSRPAQPHTPQEIVAAVVQGTQQIAKACRGPVDLEWVFDGREVVWVQMRPISAGNGLNIYSNRMAREMLPGVITPLVWSVNIPLVNGAWVRILQELIGKMDLEPESLARTFYYHAYFNMGVIRRIFEAIGMPRESLELLMGIEVEGGTRPHFRMPLRSLRNLPRLVRFISDKWRWDKRVHRFLHDMPPRYAPLASAPTERLSPQELLSGIETLFTLTRETAYYNIIVPLLLQMYHRSFRKRLSRAGVEIEQCNITADLNALDELNPTTHLARLHAHFLSLPPDVASRIKDGTYQSLVGSEDAGKFASELKDFVRAFGHLSNSGTDFSSVPWREDPDLVLRMVLEFSPPSAKQDVHRQRFEQLPQKLQGSFVTRLLYRRVRAFRLYREQIGSLYTFGYGLFRPYFLALGTILVRRGVLADARDVFFLSRKEIEQAVGTDGDGGPYGALVAARSREMDECRTMIVPETIYGDTPPPPLPSGTTTMHGVPTSRGYYKGPARVINGLEDSPKLRDGDVLVVPFSDVSWTPLFSRAGAVVAESGGMLSHSSIIAREYGIPAVVSVAGACSVPDGTMLCVDAFSGTVVLDEQHKDR